MEPSDEALVTACRSGDAAAWEALIARYQRLIYGICRQIGLDQDQCAEVFQNVFEALLKQLERIEHPALIGTWIATTTRRQAWRSLRREPTVELSLGDDPLGIDVLPDDAPAPDEIVLRQEAQHKVRTALATLDERCRRLLTLLFYRPAPAPYLECRVFFSRHAALCIATLLCSDPRLLQHPSTARTDTGAIGIRCIRAICGYMCKGCGYHLRASPCQAQTVMCRSPS
jgi:RNA polymerase sigma factor (sigma-70 family)